MLWRINKMIEVRESRNRKFEFMLASHIVSDKDKSCSHHEPKSSKKEAGTKLLDGGVQGVQKVALGKQRRGIWDRGIYQERSETHSKTHSSAYTQSRLTMYVFRSYILMCRITTLRRQNRIRIHIKPPQRKWLYSSRCPANSRSSSLS